jgi:TRAP-type mannitol/chloroaromatic compound transport system permease small subunit
MSGLEKFYWWVGRVNETVGTLTSWLIYPMALLVAFEVVMRYVFNNPTIWSWNVNVQLLAAMGSLGGGYTLLHGGHVAVDVFAKKLPLRGQFVLNSITDVLSVGCLALITWFLAVSAADAVAHLERSVTVFREPIYPLRVVVAIGSLLFLLQAICNLLKNVSISMGKTPPSTGGDQWILQ